jgi:hypothetical protein
MPYVFLTFDEIADLFHCDAAGARARVINNQWERRRWADGLTRVQVPPEVAHQFMLNYAAKHEECMTSDRGVDDGAGLTRGGDIDALAALHSMRPIHASMPDHRARSYPIKSLQDCRLNLCTL